MEFLRWALPMLDLRWRGYRRVRKQVCKRLVRRMSELHVADFDAYQRYVEGHPHEWKFLEEASHITISRFYRDRGVYEDLSSIVLPELGSRVANRGDASIACWSAGCASGEEPYSLAMLWEKRPPLKILATDADTHMIARAKRGCYERGSLKEVPEHEVRTSFVRNGNEFCVRPSVRERVLIRRQDLRQGMPGGPFDLILCRNLVLSYFQEPLQREMLAKFSKRLRGALVIGAHESLPPDSGYRPWPGTKHVYLPPGVELGL